MQDVLLECTFAWCLKRLVCINILMHNLISLLTWCISIGQRVNAENKLTA